MEIYDAIIIGAGPAGLMAARELENGHVNYLIIEAQKKVGVPLKCGEITREETFTELISPGKYPFIKNTTSRISFRIKDTQKIVKKRWFVLDKIEFLQWLSEPIKDNLRLGTKLDELKIEKNLAQIRTSNGPFQAKLVILANGTNYRVQKDLNLVKKRIEMVPCIGGFFENSTLDSDTLHFFFDEEMDNATWMFPKGNNTYNAGAGIMLKNRKTDELNLRNAFQQSLQKIGIPIQGDFSFGGAYITSGPIHRTYSDHLLVCGDAAGQVFAGIGEGIYFSLKAGQLAGQTALRAIKKDKFSSEFLKEYEINWREAFGRQMDAGVIFATLLFFLFRKSLIRYMLKSAKANEIIDFWFNGKVSFRLRLIYHALKVFGCSIKR